MRSWSWLVLPILAAIIAMVWFAQERRGDPQRRQRPCLEGQAYVSGGDYGTPGCVITAPK